MSQRVAYQGEPGAYSDVAIRQHFGDDVAPIPFRTFPDALRALADGDCDRAMIPVENAIAGPVRVALDALAPHGNSLVPVGEHRLVIVLCVLGVPGAMLATVQRVRSHPVALAQCRIFMARHPWLDVEPHADTAGAAREVAELGDRTIGAIASELAAERYGLEVLTRGVQDVPHNWTRFVIFRRGRARRMPEHPDDVTTGWPRAGRPSPAFLHACRGVHADQPRSWRAASPRARRSPPSGVRVRAPSAAGAPGWRRTPPATACRTCPPAPVPSPACRPPRPRRS